jgi:hypothetical protein
MALKQMGHHRDMLLAGDVPQAEHSRRIETLVSRQVLVGDARRWRPRWFDGRFLAASDLLAEQNYFRVRQTDLGRASGSGVIEGLAVSVIDRPGDRTDQLRIEPGDGITDTGELVTLFEPLQLNPADVPEMRRLDAAFGLQLIPTEPGHNRTGLYILALRPVEWTANPIGAYPTSLTGPRTVEDGTIVEGVAVSLIPYPDLGNEETWERRRARVARDVFVEGKDRGILSGVLPLAMVALRGNIVEWVDSYMVRRETGAERPAGMDFGFGARALREAHLLQYERHLADTLNAHRDRPFGATDYFQALPPIGRFPSGTVDAARLTQRYFPPGIDVELSFVPEDELPALIEESLLLPPIDLATGMEDTRGTTVVVLVPLSRADFAANRGALPNWDDAPPRLQTGLAQLKARATPRELLLSHLFRPVAPAQPTPEEEPWRRLLREALVEPLLWYVRRRHLPLPSNVAAVPVSATSERVADPSRLVELVRNDPRLAESVEVLRRAHLPEVDLLMRRLSATNVVDNPLLLRSLLTRASGGEAAVATSESVLAALTPATDPRLGTGLERLGAEDAALGRRLNHQRLADSGLLADVDRLARDVPEDRLPEFSRELKEAVGTAGNAPADLGNRLIQLRGRFTAPSP